MKFGKIPSLPWYLRMFVFVAAVLSMRLFGTS